MQTKIELDSGYVWMAVVDETSMHEPGTDAALPTEGYATITAIGAIFEVSQVDLEGMVEPAGQPRPS